MTERKERGRAVRAPHNTGAEGFHFGRRNYLSLAAALVTIVIGFILLSVGSITAAPILLVLGYCVLVPYGLAAGRRREETAGE